jgi:hypothetical protein
MRLLEKNESEGKDVEEVAGRASHEESPPSIKMSRYSIE